MSVSITGLGSNIDDQSIIDQLMTAAKIPLDNLNTQQGQIASATTTISSLSAKLSTLKADALALSTTSGFASLTASSSDSSVVASVTGSGATGAYDVSVSALARAQKSRSDVVASSTTALGNAGTISLQVGSGASVDVAVAATDTLTDVAAKISASGARVTASVFSDGTGYRLLVQGLDTGAANAFTVTESGASLGLGGPTSVYAAASDAKLTVDGMPVTSASNQVTGVIPGVKLALTSVNTTPATITIGSDPTALERKINTFVSAYNDFVNSGHTAAGFGSTKASNPLLAADNTIRTALHRIGALVGEAVPGSTGAYTSLGSVGITTNNDGTMSFDSTKLESALAADPTSVARLFVTDTTTGSTGVMQTFMNTVDSLVTGTSATFVARLASLGDQSKRVSDDIDKMNTQLSDYQTRLKAQFSAMDQAVSKYNAMMQQLPTSTTNTSG